MTDSNWTQGTPMGSDESEFEGDVRLESGAERA